jgi:signal transduction histidine kinase
VKRIYSQRKSLFFIFFSLIGVLFSQHVMAKNIAHEQKKIDLVDKFIQYVSWPDEAINDAFIIAIYKDAELLPLFRNELEGKEVKGKKISVINIDKIDNSQYANLLYIPAIHNSKLSTIVKSTRGHNVLIITENSNNKQNVMINLLFKNEDSKVSFEVNKLNLSRENLNISSWLLLSGGKEISASASVKDAKESMDDLVQRKLMLENELISLERKANQTLQQLEERRQKVLESDTKLKSQSKKLNNIMQESVKVQQVIITNEQKLSDLNEKIAKAKQRLSKLTKIRNDKDNAQVAALQDEYQEKFLQQMQKIDELSAALVTKEKALTEAKAALTKNKQVVTKTVKEEADNTLTILFLVLALLGIGAAIALFIKQKKAQVDFDKAQNEFEHVQTKVNELEAKLQKTQKQLIQSETVVAFSYLSSDVTFEVGATLENVVAINDKLAKTELIHQQIKTGALVPATLNNFVENIDKLTAKNAQQLQTLVTLVDNFNQIGADLDEDVKQTFDLVSYIDKMMSLVSIEFADSGVEYNYDGAKKLTIKSIPGQIAQILLNLVTNSLKHGFDGRDGGKITIHVEKSDLGGAKLVYQDNGKGMTAEELSHVFDPFYTTKPERGYVGVGMTVTYQIVTEKLAGKIMVESKVNKGVTFTIELP